MSKKVNATISDARGYGCPNHLSSSSETGISNVNSTSSKKAVEQMDGTTALYAVEPCTRSRIANPRMPPLYTIMVWV